MRVAWRVLAVVLPAIITLPAAAQERSTSWREVLYVTVSETAQASGAPGHVVGIWAMNGLALFDDGEVATMASARTLDVVRGLGAYVGYAVYTFEDDSTKTARLEVRITESLPGGGNRQHGTFAYTNGSGRFAGIDGGGTFSGRQYRPTEAGGDLLIEADARYTLPE
jgi:hypothetical protein